MLTKTDLDDIRSLFQAETRKVVRDETQKIIQKEIAPIKKSISRIEKKLDKTIDYFDDKFLDHAQRVKALETKPKMNPLFQ